MNTTEELINSFQSPSPTNPMATKCQCQTKAGTQCTRAPVEGGDRCWQHQGTVETKASTKTAPAPSKVAIPEKLFVVVHWTDQRKENECKVMGVFASREKAILEMGSLAEGYLEGRDFDERNDVRRGLNHISIGDDDWTQIFEIQEVPFHL